MPRTITTAFVITGALKEATGSTVHTSDDVRTAVSDWQAANPKKPGKPSIKGRVSLDFSFTDTDGSFNAEGEIEYSADGRVPMGEAGAMLKELAKAIARKTRNSVELEFGRNAKETVKHY